MKAAVLHEVGKPLVIEDVRVDDPGPREVLVRTIALLDDRRLIGSDMGSNAFRIDMPRFVEFYLNGKLNLDAMISQRVPLEMVNEAYADMLAGNVARTVITFDGNA
jgi:S-(hydroxymethyl)glutathione dehydrogenase/alcohol dehydrogenase